MVRKLRVTVKPLSRTETVTRKSADEWLVSVHPPAKNGKANARLIELLADHFGIAKSKIRILHGHHTRNKLVEVESI